tara:strand:- start:134 stop:373 length:240 start_codon:yes stop_codon:yes gene_type:complete
MENTSDIKEYAYNHVLARCAIAKRGVLDAERFMGFWWQDKNDQEFIEMKERQINLANKQYKIQKYLLKLLMKDDRRRDE